MRPSASPVTAVIETQPEISVPELVMNCLAPLTTHSPPSSFAVVRTLPASEPASGSVRPKEASRLPLQSCGSHSAFCSSLPQRWIGIVPSEVWAAIVMQTEESIRASSSTAST